MNQSREAHHAAWPLHSPEGATLQVHWARLSSAFASTARPALDTDHRAKQNLYYG
jgi:hypothetical protein